MNKIMPYLSSKVSWKMLAILFVVIAALVAFAPRQINRTLAEDCPSTNTTPGFNLFPISNDGANCTDYPFLRARLNSGSFNTGNISGAQPGDEIDVVLYVHNSAVEGSDAADEIKLTTNANLSAGSSHSVSASVTARNTSNSLSGSMNIQTTDGATLEVVPGSEQWYQRQTPAGGLSGMVNNTIDLPDQAACYQYARFIYFTLRVVGPAVTPPTGDISASIDGQVQGQCLWYARVIWETSGENADPVQVKVKDLTLNGPEQLMAAARDGNNRVDWIEPNHTYRFNLYILGDYSTPFKSATVTGPNLDCNPPPPAATASISANIDGQVAGQCKWYARVVWSSQNADPVQVKVRDITTGGAEQLYAAAANGNDRVNWISPNETYVFNLYALGNYSTPFKSATVTGPNLDCSPPAQPSGNITGTVGARITGQCLYTGTISWTTSNVSSALVTVDDLDDSLPAQEHSIDTSGNNPTPWLTPSHRYLYVLYNTSSSSRVELDRHSFTVPPLDCGTPPPATLVCTTLTPTVNVNQTASFSASGGSGTFSWSAPGGNPGSATNVSSFNTIYTSSGYKTVTVTRGTQTANCNVQVNQPTTPPPTPTTLVCTTLQPYTVNSGQLGSFRASGGDNTYSWTASGGNPATGSGANFSTAFTNSGSTIITKTVYVTSGSQSANCQIHINPAPVTQPLVCTTLTPNVNIGQTARFQASYGSGNYNWSAPDSTVNKTGIGSIFETEYATAGDKIVTVNDGSQSKNCAVHVNAPVTPPADLFCHLNGPSIVNINDPVSFTATGGTNSYAWNAPTGNPASRAAGTDPNFTTRFSTQGSKTVRVISGDHQASCPVITVRPPVVVCVKNVVTSFTHSAIVPVSGSSLYQTTISYNFTGSNPMKITYIDPNDGQEKVFIASTSVSGSQVFSHIEANKTYLFKLYDISSCGDLLDTMVIRKDVSPPQCVANTNFALNLSAPVKTGSTYSVVLTWTSTGSNGIKIGKNSTINIITTGNNTGSFTDTGLAAGTAHTYYMIDAECGQILTAATVVIPSEPAPVTGGDCNNSTNSCNNNTNNNNQTSSGNNSANQNNQANINGNNNVVNQTNNNCVNNSCNTNIVYILGNTTVPQNEYRALSIEKLVRNINGGSFQNSVSVNPNDTVEFQIVVRNTGNQAVNNVRVSDILPFGLSFVSGSFNGNDAYLGTLSTNDTRTLTFQARVNSGANTSIQNIARVSGDSVDQRQDDAWVFISGGSVAGGSVSLSYSKRAVNETKNADATSVVAAREDFITYTLTATNTGNTPATSFVITDDLSQVLPYADMVDKGGGSLNGNVISYPGITVPANGSVSRSFKVRVKYSLASNLSYTMSNTYGNTVTVRINTPQVLGVFVAPKTGANTLGFAFASLLTAAVGVIKKRKMLMSLIFT